MDEESQALLAKAKALSSAVNEVDLTPPDVTAAQEALQKARALMARDDEDGQQQPVWQKVVGDDGEPYYWNTETDQTQYEKPDGFVADERSERAPTPTPTDTPAKANPQTTSQGNGRFIDLPGTVSVIPGSSLVQTSQNLSTKLPKKVELSSA